MLGTPGKRRWIRRRKGSIGSNRRRGKEKSSINTRVRRRTRTLKTRSTTRRVVV